MLKRCWRNCLTAVVVLQSAAVMAQSNSMPWEQAIGFDMSLLNEGDRARVVELAEGLPNYNGCGGTIAECISADSSDQTARRLVGFLARRVWLGDSDEEIAARLAAREYSASSDYAVEIYLNDTACMGAETPLVTIVEFADFECPFCRLVAPVLEEIVAARNEEVRYCFKFFPIHSHPRGVPSCVAALAAHRQDRFWEMYDELFETSPDLSDEAMEEAALAAGLDLEQYRSDVADEALFEEVMADKFEGLELGVDRTPTIFINGKYYWGDICILELADRVDEELDMVR